MQTFLRENCHICDKKISTCGFAKTNHYRMHVREGICVEVASKTHVAMYQTGYFWPKPDYILHYTERLSEWYLNNKPKTVI